MVWTTAVQDPCVVSIYPQDNDFGCTALKLALRTGVKEGGSLEDLSFTFISALLGGEILASSTLISPSGILLRDCKMMRSDCRISSTRQRYLLGEKGRDVANSGRTGRESGFKTSKHQGTEALPVRGTPAHGRMFRQRDGTYNL